jgi:hypothetical protein
MFVLDLQIFVLRCSVCQTSLEKLDRDKHSNFLRKPVNKVQKSFITLGPGLAKNVFKLIKIFHSLINWIRLLLSTKNGRKSYLNFDVVGVHLFVYLFI